MNYGAARAWPSTFACCDGDLAALPMLVSAEPSVLPAAPLRMAFGSRCAKSPIPCNRIDYFTAHFHVADVVLLPSTDSRGFGATVSYGASMSLFHRVEIGMGGTLGIWSQANQGVVFQNGPALLNVKGSPVSSASESGSRHRVHLRTSAPAAAADSQV